MKIIDKIVSAEQSENPYYAFEFFPPRTTDGVKNLYQRAERLARQEPLYADMTWGAGGATSDLTIELSSTMKREYGLEINMHLTCTNMAPEKVDEALAAAKANGIDNIVALRGDPPKGEEEWKPVEGGFSCALDLVKHIRARHGSHFGISVAGYPEGHPNVIKPLTPGVALTEAEKRRVVTLEDGSEHVCFDADYANELAYLKSKVDAGADFIITQMFFDTEVFVQFVADCRGAGIHCPIMPGLMLIQSYAGFKRMIGFCKTRVPQWLRDQLDVVKDDDAAVKVTGTAILAAMCRAILAAGFKGLHLYTLNLEEGTYDLLRELGLFKE